jgi:hypothetical protein
MRTDTVETGQERRSQVVEPRSHADMQATATPGCSPSLHHLVRAPLKAERVLNVTVVYEDAAACQWAHETCEQMPMLAGTQSVSTTWWKLNELSQPAVLAGAVSKAMRADLIVVATRATEGFPLPFYVWVSSWLPHHLQYGKGTLVALTATPKQPPCRRNRAVDYLRAVAWRAGMRFQNTERSLAGDVPNVSEAESPERGLAILPARSERPTPLHHYAARRWRMAA